LLRQLGVDVCTHAKVAEEQPGGVRLADGCLLPSELVVWAAGVKAPDLSVLHCCDGPRMKDWNRF
jgi:NADH dehydrogenase